MVNMMMMVREMEMERGEARDSCMRLRDKGRAGIPAPVFCSYCVPCNNRPTSCASSTNAGPFSAPYQMHIIREKKNEPASFGQYMGTWQYIKKILISS
jgi:hypothetical protein